MGKKRKGGNPRNRSGSGRVMQSPPIETCRSRSNHAGHPLRHLFTSRRTVNDVTETFCSWCGILTPGSPKIPRAKGPKPASKVPEDRFSAEEPVCALPLDEWRRAQGNPARWPQASQEALLAALSEG